MTDVIFDLFGLPVVPRREGKGRPEHVWTKENSNKINLLFAIGHDLADAAAAIGITVPTLRKHYFSEITGRRYARLRMRAIQLERLNSEAAKGNVAAEKALLAVIEREQLRNLSDKLANRASKPSATVGPKTAAHLGKKDQAKLDAGNITGLYEPPAPPPSLLN